MTPELDRMIRNARRGRLGVELTVDQQLKEMRDAALDRFKMQLAHKLDMAVSLELFLGARYFWFEPEIGECNPISTVGPAIEFEVDGLRFILVETDKGDTLLRSALGAASPIAHLSSEDEDYEASLLIAIGDELEGLLRL